MSEDEAKVAAIRDMRAMFQAVADKPRRIEPLDVPGLGRVYVKGLTAAEYDEFEDGCVTTLANGEMRRKANRPLLLRHCVVTEGGTKIFKDEHIEMLAGLDSAVTNPIAAKAFGLCGASQEEAEGIAKN